MLRPLHLLSFLALAAAFVACVPEDDRGGDPSSENDPNDPNDSIESAELDLTGSAGRRVCSWNMRRLGNQFDQRPKDMKSAVKIIRDNCDLVAIQEDMATSLTTTSGNQGFDDLMKTLGPRYWGGIATSAPAPLPQTSSSEHYAFVFRKSVVSVCEGFGTQAKQLPDEEDAFIREPAWGCFKLKATDRELVLANFHAIFGEPADRKREVGFLDDDLDNNGTKDDFFNQMKAERPGDPDVVLLGDFNLSKRDMAEVLPRYVDHTIGEGSTINMQDGISPNQYDHMVVLPDSRVLAAGTQPATVLDVRDVHEPGVSFYRSVSDHLPIRFILK